MDGKPLAQKFRQGNHVKIGLRIDFADNFLHFVTGSDRNRRLGCHYRVTVQIARQFFRRRINIFQIGFLGQRMRRRSHRQHHDVGIFDRAFHVGGKAQGAGRHVFLKQLFQPVLIEGQFAAVEFVNLISQLVNADNPVSEFRQPHARRQADISGSDNSNFHHYTNILIYPKVNFQDTAIINKQFTKTSPDYRFYTPSTIYIAKTGEKHYIALIIYSRGLFENAKGTLPVHHLAKRPFYGKTDYCRPQEKV